MCALVQTVVLSWLFLKIVVAISLTCDTVSPAVQSDVTCVCKRTSGTSIDWLLDDTFHSNCALSFSCKPKTLGYNYLINSTENVYEITIMSYSYSNCTKVSCKDPSDGNIMQSVVPSTITFDSTYPTSLTEPSASHINGTISVTTGCISGYSDVKYIWYTISDGLEETYSPDPKSIFDTTDTSTCVNCSINDINGNRTIGFEHTEASGDNTKNVNFRVVLSHESTNSIINLTSSQSYTVKVKSVMAPGDSWCPFESIWICIVFIIVIGMIVCYGVAHLVWICRNLKKYGVCFREKEEEQWPHWTLCGYCCCCDPEKVCCRCIKVSCRGNKVKPATPSCLKIVENEVTENKLYVKVQWKAGWNGGDEQTFYLTCTDFDKPFVTNMEEYLIENLKERTEYKITLQAKNEYGKSEPTKEVTFTTIGKPDTPTSFRVLENEVTENSIKLQWDPGFDGGCVQKFYLSCKGFPQTFEIADVKYQLNDLQQRTEYKMTLCAGNKVGKSEPTDELKWSTFGEPDKPSAFKYDLVKKQSITVQWSKGYDGGYKQSFVVKCKNNVTKEEQMEEIGASKKGKMKHTFSNLTEDTLYKLSIYAVNLTGRSETQTIQVKTHSNPYPPEDFHCENVTENSIKVQWKPGYNGGTKQTFTLKCSDNHPDFVIEEKKGVIEYTFEQLTAAKLYIFSLEASNSEGKTHCEPLNVRTLGEPDKPSSFKYDLVKKQSITVQWSKGYDGGYTQSFVVKCKNKATEEEKMEEIGASTNKKMKHAFSNLTEDTLYKLSIYAVNLIGRSETQTIEVKTHSSPYPPYEFHCEDVTENSIKVQWKPGYNGGAKQKFTLKCSDNRSNVVIEEKKGIMEHTFEDLVAGKIYTLSIQSSNSEGKTHCEPLNVRTLGLPDEPSGFEVVQQERQKTSIKVKWTPGYNGGFTQQFILSCLQNHKEVNEPEIIPDERKNYVDGHLEHTFNNLKEYTRYVLKIAAQNEKGKSKECCIDEKTKGFPQKS